MRTIFFLLFLVLSFKVSYGQKLNGVIQEKTSPGFFVDNNGKYVVKICVAIDPKKSLVFKGPIKKIVFKKQTYDNGDISKGNEEHIPAAMRRNDGIIEVMPDADSTYLFYIRASPASKLEIFCPGIEEHYESSYNFKEGHDYIINLNILPSSDSNSERVGGWFLGSELLPIPSPKALVAINGGFQFENGLNLEAGFGMTMAKSDELYIYNTTNENVTKQQFCKYQTYFHVGYDLFHKKQDWLRSVCIMPQLGFSWDCIKGKSNSLSGYNAYSVTAGLRIGGRIKINNNYLVLYATPEIAKVWNKPESNYQIISDNLSAFKMASEKLDFRLRLGVQLYFGK